MTRTEAISLYFFPMHYAPCTTGDTPRTAPQSCADCSQNDICVQLLAYSGDAVAVEAIAVVNS